MRRKNSSACARERTPIGAAILLADVILTVLQVLKLNQKLAEIDKLYQSKLAEAQLSADQRLIKESDPAKAEEIRNGLVTELASIRDRWEREKEKIRNE